MINIYNLLLYNVAATSAALLLYCFILNRWMFLISCCKTRRKMLVFDRLNLFPLTLVLLSCSPLYNLPFHFDTISYCLECLGLSLAEYARYSLLFYSPLFVLPDRPLQSTLEPWSLGAGDPRSRPLQREYP